MGFSIDRGFFSSHAEMMEDIGRTGYWPTTYVSGASPELPLHYHDYDVIGYCVDGEGYLLDEDGQHQPIKAGDRLNLPKGAWHAEGAVADSMTYVVTVSEPVGLFEALAPREPRGAMPNFSSLNIRT